MSSASNPSPVTQRELAKALGLSHATISLALRDSPKISVARREEIKAKAAEMGYKPNPAAAALAHFKKTSTVTPVRAAIAWFNFWPDKVGPRRLIEFDRYWQGASEAAESLGYHLEEFSGSEQSPERLSQILYHRGITGILLPPHGTPPDFGNFDWSHFSIIRFGRSISNPKSHLVGADQVANMILCFKKSLELGYKRIGFIAGRSSLSGPNRFDAGYLKAQLGLKPSQRLPICTVADQTHSDTVAILKRWVEKNKPDAVITTNPQVPNALKEAGYRIPEDLAVAGMSVLDGNVDSGIYQNPKEIGRAALFALAGLITTNSCGIPKIVRQTLIQGKWLDGESMPKRSSV